MGYIWDLIIIYPKPYSIYLRGTINWGCMAFHASFGDIHDFRKCGGRVQIGRAEGESVKRGMH